MCAIECSNGKRHICARVLQREEESRGDAAIASKHALSIVDMIEMLNRNNAVAMDVIYTSMDV